MPSSFIFRTNQGKLQYSNTYYLLGQPAPVTINSVVASASPFIYPVTTADVSGTSITNGINYKVLSFASVSTTTTYTVNYTCNNATTIYVLAVGGGGSGGVNYGGGGGGGGVVMMPVYLPASTSQTISISIGAGAPSYVNNNATGTNGSNTTVTFNGTGANVVSVPSIIAYGGGGGSGATSAPSGGASGGGGSSNYLPGTAINNNYNYANNGAGGIGTNPVGGGGGGAGTSGAIGSTSPTIGGNGGNGIKCFLPGICNFTPSGTAYGTYYWGGGGGGSFYSSTIGSIGGNGGLGGGGGGNGQYTSGSTGNPGLNGYGGISIGTAGTTSGNSGYGGANTGGGGGAAWFLSPSATVGAGGSGIVIIAFPTVTAVTSNQSAVLPASIVSSGLYSATLNNATLSSLAYSSIKGAYACRLLNYNYFGPIMTLRNSADTYGNNTQNFYADVFGNLGTQYLGTGQSVSAWLSANSANTTYAYVTKWYGQGMDVSFNSATQYTTTFQPIYDVANGVINYGYTGGTGVSALNIGYLNLPTNSFPINDSSFTVITKYYNDSVGNNNTQQFLLSLNNSFNYLALNNNTYPGFNFGSSYSSSVGLNPLLPSSNTVITYKYTSWTTSGTLSPNIQIYQNGTASTGTATNSASTVVNSVGAHAYTQSNVTIGNNPSSAYACSSVGTLGTATNYYLQAQLYNLYVFSSALTDTDRNMIEATPYTYSASATTAIAGLSATNVTSTNFSLSWTALASPNYYILWVNGSMYGSYTAGSAGTYTTTVTPGVSGPWTLGLYAYNSSNVLLASGSVLGYATCKIFLTFDNQVNSTGAAGTGYFPNMAINANNTSNNPGDLFQIYTASFSTTTFKYGGGSVTGGWSRNNASYQFNQNGLSFCMWGYFLSTLNTSAIFGWDDNAGGNALYLNILGTSNNWNIQYNFNALNGTITCGMLNNTWYHLCWTISPATFGSSCTYTLYLNGAVISTVSGTYPASTSIVYRDILSKPGSTGNDNMYLDNFRFYESTLNAFQVQSIYAILDPSNTP